MTYHPFYLNAQPLCEAEFQEAIQEVLDGIPTIHAESLAKLMMLNFPQFDAVSLLPAQGINEILRQV